MRPAACQIRLRAPNERGLQVTMSHMSSQACKADATDHRRVFTISSALSRV